MIFTFALVFLIFSIIIVIWCTFQVIDDFELRPIIWASSMFLFFLSMLTGIVACMMSLENRPTAIDVYRGNTTLQVTYQDSAAIDSIVVFKNGSI